MIAINTKGQANISRDGIQTNAGKSQLKVFSEIQNPSERILLFLPTYIQLQHEHS